MRRPALSKAYLFFWLAATSMLLAAACTADELLRGEPTTSLPNGVAAGDVSQTGVVLWAYTSTAGPVTFTVASATGTEREQVFVVTADASRPVTVTVTDLTPASTYRYAVRTVDGETASGRFRTAAMVDAYYGSRFGVSGDWRGSLTPFVALRNAPSHDLDFFVALGDTVYADMPSPALRAPRAETLTDFRRKHAEVYSERLGFNLLADLRASVAWFATIDDHEVLNDVAGGALAADDPRLPETTGRINHTTLYDNALQAFQEYNPIQQESYGVVGGDGRMDGAPQLYRYRLFGHDAAIFLLDARSFRDLPVRRANRNDPTDVARFRADTFRPGRTMLGLAQLADLKRDLLDAQEVGVTWKFVLLPEPIQHRGLMSAQDRFEGYAAERTDLLQFIADNAITNIVFVAADIHGTLVNNVTYSVGPEMPQIPTQAFEVTVGPVAYAPTLGPVVIVDGRNKEYVSPEEQTAYDALPIAPDADTIPDDRDDFVRAILDRELMEGGYDPIGLDGAPIAAALIQGDYVALHSYGWTEFVIDRDTQRLTVTTYGIPAYTETDLLIKPLRVLGSVPQIVSQFQVAPQQ